MLGKDSSGGGGSVYNGCREGSVSPTLAPGFALQKPLSPSLGSVYVCVIRGCNSVTVQSDIHTSFSFSCPVSHSCTHIHMEREKVSTCDISPDISMITLHIC